MNRLLYCEFCGKKLVLYNNRYMSCPDYDKGLYHTARYAYNDEKVERRKFFNGYTGERL